MINGCADKVRRDASNFDRGIVTAGEFADALLDSDVLANASDEEIAAAIEFVPGAVLDALQGRMEELATADYYRKTFGIGDSRTADQIHADAVARQPILRRLCDILVPLVLDRTSP